MEMNIRRGRSADWQALVEFNCQMAKETENLVLDKETVTNGVQALLADNSQGFYVIAEVDGVAVNRSPAEGEMAEIAGSLMVTTEWSDWRNGVFWWVQSVYIRPEFRRQGIYRQLYAHVKKLAAEADHVCGFRLYVEKENEVAQKTYEALGMDETHYLMYEEGWSNR